MHTKRGRLILLSGPAGVGKDSIIDIVTRREPSLQKSVSVTTRGRRESERDGVDYCFIARPAFERMIAGGELLEFVQYGQNLYGTPKKPVDRWLSQGKNVILKIEVQGAHKIRELYPDSIAVFILPPSVEALEVRLRRRGTESETELRRRLDIAKEELKKCGDYDFAVVNDELGSAADEILKIIEDHCIK